MNDEERPLTPDEIARYENIAPVSGCGWSGCWKTKDDDNTNA